MGKKKKEILDKEFAPFSKGMRANGYSEAAIGTLWEILVPFSDYALQQGALRRLRRHLVLDRIPQGELPRGVHGGAC